MTYRQKVFRYFRLEYSDLSLLEMLRKVRIYQDASGHNDEFFTTIKALKLQNEKSFSKKKKWTRKIREIILAHEQAGHNPAIPAQKIASILQAATGIHFLNGLEVS